MKERSLSRCQCDNCGSHYAVNYDDANEQYICDDCLDAEDNAEEIEESDEITNDDWTRMVL